MMCQWSRVRQGMPAFSARGTKYSRSVMQTSGLIRLSGAKPGQYSAACHSGRRARPMDAMSATQSLNTVPSWAAVAQNSGSESWARRRLPQEIRAVKGDGQWSGRAWRARGLCRECRIIRAPWFSFAPAAKIGGNCGGKPTNAGRERQLPVLTAAGLFSTILPHCRLPRQTAGAAAPAEHTCTSPAQGATF